jgi:hypothetical protein
MCTSPVPAAGTPVPCTVGLLLPARGRERERESRAIDHARPLGARGGMCRASSNHGNLCGWVRRWVSTPHQYRVARSNCAVTTAPHTWEARPPSTSVIRCPGVPVTLSVADVSGSTWCSSCWMTTPPSRRIATSTDNHRTLPCGAGEALFSVVCNGFFLGQTPSAPIPA